MKTKQLKLIILTLVILITATTHANAIVQNDIYVFVNGNQINFQDQNPVIDNNNRTLVPARAVFEAMGAKVEWDAKNWKVNISYPNANIILTINSNVALVDGKKVSMDTQAVLINARTVVPLRFVSESIGAKVDYKYVNRMHTINITTTETNQTGVGTATTDVAKNVEALNSLFPAGSTNYKPGDADIYWNPLGQNSVINLISVMSTPDNSKGEEILFNTATWPLKGVPALENSQGAKTTAEITKKMLQFYFPNDYQQIYTDYDKYNSDDDAGKNPSYKKTYNGREVQFSTDFGMGANIHISSSGKKLQ